MVVSSVVLVRDVSTRAGDVLRGIAVFPNGWIFSQPFEKSDRETVKLRQHSIRVQPIIERVRSLKHVKLRVDT